MTYYDGTSFEGNFNDNHIAGQGTQYVTCDW